MTSDFNLFPAPPSFLPPGAFFCRADEFICNNTLCKLHTWVCDGKDDCGDNSDEDADMCGER